MKNIGFDVFFSLKNYICKIFSNGNDIIFMKKTFTGMGNYWVRKTYIKGIRV